MAWWLGDSGRPCPLPAPGPRDPRSGATQPRRSGNRTEPQREAPPALPAALGSSEDPLEDRRRGPGGGSGSGFWGCWLRGPARGTDSGRGTWEPRACLELSEVLGWTGPGPLRSPRPTPDGGLEQGDSVCRVLRPSEGLWEASEGHSSCDSRRPLVYAWEREGGGRFGLLEWSRGWMADAGVDWGAVITVHC